MSKEEIPEEDTRSACCDSSKPSCTGGCGGPGLCPGIALGIAWAVGFGLMTLTGREWIGWSVGIPLGLILLTGAWKWLPKRS